MNARSALLVGIVGCLMVAAIPYAGAQSTSKATIQHNLYSLSDGSLYACTTWDLKFDGSGSRDAGGYGPVKYAWTVNTGAFGDGSSAIAFKATTPGEQTVGLTVSFRDDSSASTRVGFKSVRCDNQTTPPTASPGPTCDGNSYYNSNTGKCETYANSPPPTASPGNTYSPDPEKCRTLQYERERFESDWKYRYHKYYEEARKEPGSDASFEEKMRGERESYQASWQERWRSSGCDYSGSSSQPNNECQQRFQSAEAEFKAAGSRYETAWKQYYSELEQARRDFGASGYRNESEWKQFEEKWRTRAHDLTSQMKADMEAIAAKYRLHECGYYSGQFDGARPEPVYATPPATAPAYVEARSECEEKMMAIKGEYGARFEELYRKLETYRSRPDSPEYAQARNEIQQLEEQVRLRMEAIMQECRDQYKTQYSAPENFRDGIGSLQCYMDPSDGLIRCEGKYISFRGDPNTQTLGRYSCGGQLFYDRIYANNAFEDFQFGESDQGSTLNVRSSNLKMALHDGPRGVIHVGVVGGAEIYFVPATHLRVTAEGNRVLVEGADTRGAWLGGADALAWDESKRVLTIKSEATWVSESCLPDGSKPDGARDPAYWDAIRARKLGAQVVITVAGEKVEQDNETYAKMRVQVNREADRRYLAVVDSDEETCQTVVLKFNSGIFASINLKVVVTDEDGNRLTVQEASDLDDVLEPCDDGPNTFEYWIVQDRHGTQVLVSFAHFSEKRVSVEAANIGGLQVPGFEFAVLALAVGALAVVARRRR